MNFEAYKYIAVMMVLLELIVLIFAYKRDSKFVFYAVLLSITLKGQYLWFGRAFYAWQFAAIVGLAYSSPKIKYLTSIGGQELNNFRSFILFYFIYTFSISIPTWAFFSVEGLIGDSGSISFSRVVTQTIYFLLLVGIYRFGYKLGNFITTTGLLRGIITIATVVAYGAILQVIVVNTFGINLFPIIGSNDTIRSAYLSGSTFRATSFAGEPKHLGLLMSMGLTAYFLSRLFRIPVGRRLTGHIPLSMITALLLSLSTTGILITVFQIGILSILFVKRIKLSDLAAVSILSIILITQVFGTGSDYSSGIEKQISKNEFEVQDQSVSDALNANPLFLVTGTGLGNIHLIAVEYLPSNFPLFRDQGYKANSGLFYVLGDSGLIGLVLLIIAPFFALQSYMRMRKTLTTAQRKEAIVTVSLLLISLVSFMLRYDVSYFLFAGFAFSRLAILRAHSLGFKLPSQRFKK